MGGAQKEKKNMTGDYETVFSFLFSVSVAGMIFPEKLKT